MSELLARVARTLTHHWKRSAAAALLVLVLLGAAAGAGGEAADDFSIPGTESQQALDLFKAHSPSFAGAATLVSARTFVYVVSPRENAARIPGSSWSASATRMYSRASRPVTPHR